MEDLDPKYKQEGWTVPEAYFDSLEDKVLERLRQAPGKPEKTRVIRWGKAFAIAASVAILAMVTILSYRSAGADENELSFNDLDSMDIVYFENNEELNDEEFEEFVPDSVVDTMYREQVQSHFINTYINEKDLEDLQEEYSILDDEIDI